MKKAKMVKSKAFSAPVRAQNGPTNTSPKAVAKTTYGRPGAGKMASHGKVNTQRVVQVKPAQRSAKTSPTSKTVTSQPRSLAGVRKSLRKTMGY